MDGAHLQVVVQDPKAARLARQLSTAPATATAARHAHWNNHTQRRSMNLRNRSRAAMPKSVSVNLLEAKGGNSASVALVSLSTTDAATASSLLTAPRNSFAHVEPILRRLSLRPPTHDNIVDKKDKDKDKQADDDDTGTDVDELVEVRLQVPNVPRRTSVRSLASRSVDFRRPSNAQGTYSNTSAYQLPLESSAISTFCGIKKRRLRLVVLGARGVGKTSIIEQFVCSSNSSRSSRSSSSSNAACTAGQNTVLSGSTSPTANHYYPIVVTNDCLYDLHITECPPCIHTFPKSAEDEFLHFRGFGLRRASCYILVYDVANHDSFEYIRSLREQIQDYLNDSTASAGQQKSFAKLGKILGNSGLTHTTSTADSTNLHNAHKSDGNACTAAIIVVGNKVDLTTAAGSDTPGGTKKTFMAAGRFEGANSQKSDLRCKQHDWNSAAKAAKLHKEKEKEKEKERSGEKSLLLSIPLAFPKRKSKSETDAPSLSSLFSAHHVMQSAMLVPKVLPRGTQSNVSTATSVSSLANLVLAHRAHSTSPSLMLDHAAFVKKYWKVTHVEVSAKFNWHVSQLFKDVIRVVDESENRHTNGKKSHNSMHFRFNIFKRQKDSES